MKRRTFLHLATSSAVTTMGGLTFAQTRGYAAPAPAINVVLPAIVIGSGYGGAVSALRLCQAGVETTVIEMGKLWDYQYDPHTTVFSSMLTADERSMWFKDATDMPFGYVLGLPVINKPIGRGPGVLDKVYFDDVAVYLGRAVGGGSVVNGGMAPTPNRDFLAEKLPAAVVNDLYATYFDRAKTELKVSAPGQDILASGWYDYSRKSAGDARNAGYQVDTIPNVYDWDHWRDEVAGRAVASATAGQVIFGNDHGKNSLDKTYLATANATGYLRLLSLTQVTDIAWDGEAYQVTIQTHDQTWKLLDTKVLRTTRLFVAAGVLGTVELLLKAKKSGGLAAINDELGRGFGTNGNHMIARSSWTSTGTTWASAIPAQAINNWADPSAQVLAEIAPVPANFELFLSLYLAIARTEQRATFGLDANNELTLDWRAEQANAGAAKVYRLFDSINAANWTIYRYDLFGNGQPLTSGFTYHPLGGAILGKVTDEYGRVHGYQGLYVMDGSLVPGQVGVNPFLTITAIAERNIDQILAADFGTIPAGLPRPNESIRLRDNQIQQYAGRVADSGALITGAGLSDRYLVRRDDEGHSLVHAASGEVVTTTPTGVSHAKDTGAVSQRFAIAGTGGWSVQARDGGAYLAGAGEGQPVTLATAPRLWDVVEPQPFDAAPARVEDLPLGAAKGVRNAWSWLVMNVQGGYRFSGAFIQTWSAYRSDVNQFIPEKVGEKVRLKSARSGLAVARESDDEGARLRQVDVDDADPRQLFTLLGNAESGYFLAGAPGTLVVTQLRGAMALTMNTNVGMPLQRWKFIDL